MSQLRNIVSIRKRHDPTVRTTSDIRANKDNIIPVDFHNDRVSNQSHLKAVQSRLLTSKIQKETRYNHTNLGTKLVKDKPTVKGTKTRIKWFTPKEAYYVSDLGIPSTGSNHASPKITSKVYDKGNARHSYLIDATGQVFIANSDGLTLIGQTCVKLGLSDAITDSVFISNLVESYTQRYLTSNAIKDNSRNKGKKLNVKKGKVIHRASKQYINYGNKVYMLHVTAKGKYFLYPVNDSIETDIVLTEHRYLDTLPYDVNLSLNHFRTSQISNLPLDHRIVVYQFDHKLDHTTDYRQLDKHLRTVNIYHNKADILDRNIYDREYLGCFEPEYIQHIQHEQLKRDNDPMVGSITFDLPDYELFAYHIHKLKHSR